VNEAVTALVRARTTAENYRDEQIAKAEACERELAEHRAEAERMESRISDINTAIARLEQ